MNVYSIIKIILYSLKIFIVNFFILYLFLFVIELYFQFNKKTLFSDSKYIYRDKLIKKYNENVHLAFAPYKLIGKKNELFPLSGISNTRTLLCEDNGEYIEYFSDNFGFNNKTNKKDSDLLIIGDSYVHGLCLNQKDIFSAKFNSTNLAMQANGPLIQYATYREYADQYNFEKLIWVFTPDNDFYDFDQEAKDNILQNYLNDPDYSQDLLKNEMIKNKIIEDYFNYRERKIKETLKHYHLDLKYIRTSISGLIDKISFDKKKYEDDIYKIDYYQNTLVDIKNIISKVNSDLNNQDKEFFIVFNAIHPIYKYNKTNLNKEHFKGIVSATNELKEHLKENNIKFLDFEEFVSAKFNEENINYIFKKKGDGYDHYTIEGNNILAEKIKNFIK